MHKNTFLLVVFLAVISVLVAFVNLRNQSQTPQTTNTPTPTQAPKLVRYTNTFCGISFSYFDALQKIESATNSAVFVNQANPQDSILVTCQDEIPRVPLPPEKMEPFVIQGSTVSAVLYHDASQKDGVPIDKLIFTHPTKNIDVFIAGLGDAYTALISSLELL